MDIAAVLRDDYNLEPVTEVVDMSARSGCYRVTIGDRRYVLKQVGRPDFASVYDKVQRALNEQELVQARVIPTRDGQVMRPDGYWLLEYIAGEAPVTYDDAQFVQVLSYLRRYNQALRAVPFVPAELSRVNIWDLVKSTDFLRQSAATIAERSDVAGWQRSLLNTATGVLADNSALLERAPKQLIHADVGPGNVIFAAGRVRAIIDFTPDFEHELYSLAHFLYWTCLFGAQQPPQGRFEAALDTYSGRPPSAGDQQLMFVYLVKACLLRIMGPALSLIETNTFSVARIERRLAALASLLESFHVRF
ncbi:MAG: phosphotransferase enzyme family protein [Chloroflexota bacterium]